MQGIDDQWYKDRWDSIPAEMKRAIVAHLRAHLKPDVMAEIRKAIKLKGSLNWIGHNHFGWGMGVRNLLRDVVTDDKLPSAPYPDGRGEYRNWDDYYIQAVEAAVMEEP